MLCLQILTPLPPATCFPAIPFGFGLYQEGEK